MKACEIARGEIVRGRIDVDMDCVGKAERTGGVRGVLACVGRGSREDVGAGQTGCWGVLSVRGGRRRTRASGREGEEAPVAGWRAA